MRFFGGIPADIEEQAPVSSVQLSSLVQRKLQPQASQALKFKISSRSIDQAALNFQYLFKNATTNFDDSHSTSLFS